LSKKIKYDKVKKIMSGLLEIEECLEDPPVLGKDILWRVFIKYGSFNNPQACAALVLFPHKNAEPTTDCPGTMRIKVLAGLGGHETAHCLTCDQRLVIDVEEISTRPYTDKLAALSRKPIL